MYIKIQESWEEILGSTYHNCYQCDIPNDIPIFAKQKIIVLIKVSSNKILGS